MIGNCISSYLYNELFSESNKEKYATFPSMAWSLVVHKNTIRNCSTALQAFSFRSLSFYQKQPTEAFCKKKGAVRNFAKFTGKQLCQSLFFSKVAGLEFCEISKSMFLQNTSRRLLLLYLLFPFS